jgi:hypothetical protein
MNDIGTSAKKSLVSIVSALLVIILSAMPAMAFGGTSSGATITLVDARSDGNFSIVITPAVTGGPACANASSAQLTGNATTASGKTMLAIAQSSFLAGKHVTIEGLGVCNEYPGYESISRIASTN